MYFIKNPLHLCQVATPLPDGSLKVELDIHNPKEFIRYMLRFSEGVTFTGSPEVMEELRSFLGEMMGKYLP